MKKLLVMVCSLAAAVTMAAASEPDRGKVLSQKIEPALKSIEKLLDEIEADFWKNIWEFDIGGAGFLRDSPRYSSFNSKIVSFVSRCGALQGELYKSGVDVKVQYPIEKTANGILQVWKRLPELHVRMMERRNSVLREVKETLGKDRISSIYLTREIPKNICNYEALLDDLAIINLELFYIDQRNAWQKMDDKKKSFRIVWRIYSYYEGREIPPGWNDRWSSTYCKFLSEDLLISSAGEFFMAVRDLRLFLRGLRRDPFPKPVQYDDPYDLICRIEEDLNQIEREFWDNLYKGGTAAAKSNNFSRYEEFRRRLYRMYDNSRIFLNLLRGKKIAYEKFNPVPDALIIYNLGRTHDQELHRQMILFFNRASPLEPDSKRDRVKFVYHFRAYDANAENLFSQFRKMVSEEEPYKPGYWEPSPKVVSRELSTSKPYRIQSYLPSAELKLLNVPERLDETCESNIAIFQSDEGEFKTMAKSSREYFTAVKKLRLSIWHWKEQFAPAGPSQPEPEEVVAESWESNPEEKLFQTALNKLKQKRIPEAETILSQLAERDYVPAWYLLSQISGNRGYSRPRTDDANLSPQERWLEKAAEAGYVPAVDRWFRVNMLDSFEKQEKALRFADKIQAIWLLPEKLARMSADKRDQWLNKIRKRAEGGEATCQLLLSYCYTVDNIIDPSPVKAKEWLQKAVEQKHPEALALVWGWHPMKWWNTFDRTWTDKAIAAGAIPVIAVSTLGESSSQASDLSRHEDEKKREDDLPASALSHLEEAGKRGDELAMLALICYYSKREINHSSELEYWTHELSLYRSLQRLGYGLNFRGNSAFYRELEMVASKAMR